MKILYLDVLCKSGSTGKIVYELYRRARAEGHEAAVCYGRGAKVEEENIFKFGLDWETRLHALLTRLTGLTGCFSYFSTRRLLRYIDRFKPDIIHLHEPHAYFLNLKPFFTYISRHNIPLVYTFHCEFAYTGKCGYSYDCSRFETGCGSCPRLREYPKTLGPDFTSAMHAQKKALLCGLDMHIVTPSQWLADRAKRSFLRDCDMSVIRNGIDSENVFYPRSGEECERLKKLHGIKDEKVVLAVAPCFISDKRKGGEYVIKLAERMQQRNVRFVMVGVDGDIEPEPSDLIALGRTENQHELACWYSLADAFLICSDMENLPTTCLEAVCCGTGVVGFEGGGTAETAPAPLGLFCSYGDIDALEEKLLQMLQDPPDAALFEEMRRLYSSENMYREYSKLYKTFLEGKQK